MHGHLNVKFHIHVLPIFYRTVFFFKHFWSLTSMLHAQLVTSSVISWSAGGWIWKIMKLFVRFFPLYSYHILYHRFKHFPSTLLPKTPSVFDFPLTLRHNFALQLCREKQQVAKILTDCLNSQYSLMYRRPTITNYHKPSVANPQHLWVPSRRRSVYLK